MESTTAPQSMSYGAKKTTAEPIDIRSKNDVTYEMFVRKVYERMEHKQALEQIVEQEKKTAEKVKLLQKQVVKERQLKEQEIIERTLRVTELTNELRQLKKLTKEESEKNVATSDGNFECRRRNEVNILREMREKLIEVDLQLNLEKEVHNQTKKFLTNKNVALQGMANDWDKKNEKESEDAQTTLGIWENKRKDQLELLDTLEQEYKKELFEQKIREEQEKRQREQERMAFELKMNDCATRVKLMYKCFKARQFFEQLVKEKSKKKPSKKKKKGKK